MAATALTPAVQPAVSSGNSVMGQEIGQEGRDLTDVGIPEVLPQPWETGAILPGSPVPTGNAGPIESSGIDYLGVEYQGVPVDTTPWPDYAGDPDRPANGETAMLGHDWDQGAPAALRTVGDPDIGKPVLQQFATQSTDRQPVYSANGEMVELPGERTAPSANWFNNQNVNVGIGYYMQETERPFYNTPAEVPGAYDGPGGQDQPDNRYSSWIYNDGGIPPAYVSPPDAPVAAAPVQVASVPDDLGYGGSY